MTETKPFVISKALIWEAYQRVKANKGVAGIDGQTIEEFASDEKKNLYRIWNRMSSGSYLPPSIRAVSIPNPIQIGFELCFELSNGLSINPS